MIQIKHLSNRVCRHQARKACLQGDGESAFLSERAGSYDAMDALRVSSITYRIATGKPAGRKEATLPNAA